MLRAPCTTMIPCGRTAFAIVMIWLLLPARAGASCPAKQRRQAPRQPHGRSDCGEAPRWCSRRGLAPAGPAQSGKPRQGSTGGSVGHLQRSGLCIIDPRGAGRAIPHCGNIRLVRADAVRVRMQVEPFFRSHQHIANRSHLRFPDRCRRRHVHNHRIVQIDRVISVPGKEGSVVVGAGKARGWIGGRNRLGLDRNVLLEYGIVQKYRGIPASSERGAPARSGPPVPGWNTGLPLP